MLANSFLNTRIEHEQSGKDYELAEAGYFFMEIVYLIIEWMAVEAAIAGGETGKRPVHF